MPQLAESVRLATPLARFGKVDRAVSEQWKQHRVQLRASDGTTLGTFPVGREPQGVAFDGANIWAADRGSNTVTKLRASDGMALGTFEVGSSPVSIAFDGANVVVNFASENVTKLRASDGTLLGTFSAASEPGGIAFDGANIWVSNSEYNTVTNCGPTME